MKLNSPFIITARFLPGLQIGKDSFLSIEYADTTSDGRTRYRYHIDTPAFEHTGEDLKSGVGGGSLQKGMEDLLSFLGSAAESYRYAKRHAGGEAENLDLFPAMVNEWAYQNLDELSMLQCELEETDNLIEE